MLTLFERTAKPCVRTALAIALTVALPSAAAARDFYVAPNGVSSNDGSIGRPLDLATAISSATPARPGDTIWMRGGLYRGSFTSNLTGTASQPITLRQFPGERATVDNGSTSPATATFVVLGAYAIYWGFEITNSDFNRSGGISSRGTGLDIYGHHTKFINMVVHDAQTGVGFWTPASDSELYGLIIYDNGVDASDRGHGHSIYTQNDTGIKRIADNIAFNSFSFGIHAYTEGGRINNLQMDGNVLFNHGILSAITGAKSNLLLGGGQVARNAVISNTFSYYTPSVGGRGADIGYGVGCDSATVTSNIWDAPTALNFNCSNTTFTGNTTYGYAGSLPSTYPSNTYLSSRPTGTQVFVRNNQYEPKRANIIVFNWARQTQVSVDLSGTGLAAGDEYEIRDVQDFWGPPVVSGVYSGSPVSLYMLGSSVSVPVGNVALPRHTDQEFGAFVLMPKSASTGSTTPTASLAANPTTIVAGQAATLSWSTFAASSASLTGVGAVPTFGSVTVTPSTTTTYTLTASGTNGATATSSATITVTAAPPAGANSALFLRSDTTTKGSWKGTYGSEGYTLANDGTNLPATLKVTFGQQMAWTWSASNSDPRALVKAASTTDRIAATWYSTGTFTIDVDVKDGAAHEMALYSLDWDSQARVQTIQIVDFATGAQLDSRSVSGFSGGQYHIWRVTGHVVVRITRSGPNSSALSGVFFAPAGGGGTTPANVPPTVTLTSPAAGTPFTAPASIPLAATAGDSDGTVAQVSFFQGTTAIGNGTWNGTAYTLNWNSVAAGTYRLTARATDSSGESTTSSYVDITVGSGTTPPTPPSSGATTAVFAKSDTALRGSWQGTYGRDGFMLAGDAASLPAYAQVSFSGQSAWTWSALTSDTRALQKMTATGRIAACWYSAGTFNIDVTLSDTAAHQVTLYALDWDGLGRSETVQVVDAVTGAVLDTRTISGFSAGQYYSWQVTGHVLFKVTRTNGANATVSGIFFDGAGAATAAPPTVTMATPAGPFTSPASIQLSANASSTTSTIGQVSFFEGTTLLGTSPNTSNPFTFQWTGVGAGPHTIFATATDGTGLNASSQPVTVTVNSPAGTGGTTATWVKLDSTTKGSWKGVFGSQGYVLPTDATQLPTYAQVKLQGETSWLWAASSMDTRATQRATWLDRFAACWYAGGSFTIDVNLTDGVAHQVALYNLDWDALGRGQTIEIRDATTGALMDSRSITAFQGGQYAAWRISGHVTITVTRTAGSNAVVNGVFIDP